MNELGNWLGEIALAVLVFDETGSALATAALFLGMQFLPALFAQGVVARVEVTGTRIGLPAIYATEAVTFIVLATLVDNFVLAAIVVLAAFDGTLALAGRAFTRAAAAAVLNPPGQLREGNALLNIGFTRREHSVPYRRRGGRRLRGRNRVRAERGLVFLAASRCSRRVSAKRQSRSPSDGGSGCARASITSGAGWSCGGC